MLSPVPVPTGMPAGRPSAAAASEVRYPAISSAPRTVGTRTDAARSGPMASASRSRRTSPVAGDHHPEPEASPRSVVSSPVRRYVSQSCGKQTAAIRLRASRSVRTRWASFAIVNEATSLEPTSRAKSASPFSRSASGAASTLFQSGGGPEDSAVAIEGHQPVLLATDRYREDRHTGRNHIADGPDQRVPPLVRVLGGASRMWATPFAGNLHAVDIKGNYFRRLGAGVDAQHDPALHCATPLESTSAASQ